jgi:hypothetical protein
LNDDDMVGCWAFIRSDNHNASSSSYKLNSKKYSLDSKLPLTVVKTVTPSAKEDTANLLNTKSLANSKVDVNYDRVFYRGIQKSLDEIFAHADDTLAASQRRIGGRVERVSSKSSDDLSMYGTAAGIAVADEMAVHSENPYRFQRYGSESKFKRECFFTKESHSLDSSSTGDRNTRVSDNLLNSTSSSSSSKLVLDSSPNNNNNNNNNNSLKNSCRQPITQESWTLNDSFERSNSICSDTSSSVGGGVGGIISSSRKSSKSSVTFRTKVETSIDDDDDDHAAPHNPSAALLRTNAGSADISVFRSGLKSSLKYYDLPTPIVQTSTTLTKKPSFTKTTLRNKIDKTKQKTKSYSITRTLRKLRLLRSPSTTNNSSSYARGDPGNEMSEQLLVNDEAPVSLITATPLVGGGGSTNSGATLQDVETESPYDTIRYTNNFVLARTNNGN